MATRRLRMACGSEELEVLYRGNVRFDGIAVEVERLSPQERHHRMAESLDFDVCEYSLCDYVNGFDRELPFTAIPCFPHRVFRHRDIWVSRTAGKEKPGQLDGCRFGIQSWGNTAALWQRGILRTDFGVDLSSIEWIRELPERGERYRWPDWVRIRQKPGQRSLETMLAEGEIAALMLPRPPRFSPAEAPRVRRLFPDYAAVEQDYHRRTGLFPIMHVVVLKNSLLDEDPGVARAVFSGLQRALDDYVRGAREGAEKSAVWPQVDWAEQERSLGAHPWPGGLAANRRELEVLLQYALEQGIIRRPVAPEALFQFRGRLLVDAD